MAAHDEHEEQMIRTDGKRLGKGIAIVVITLAVCTGILLTFWDEMVENPPPVTQIQAPKPPSEPKPPAAGTTTISILSGAAVQGNPDYEPDDATVPLGNKIVWSNDDTVPHTATSGTGPEDPDMGTVFDTSIIDGGESSDPVDTSTGGFKAGDIIAYFCAVHPFMTSQLTITEAGAGGSEGGSEAAGPTLDIPSGAAVQGNPSYSPAELTVTKGDVIKVTNSDNVPHTVTRGTDFEDPNMGQGFDTSIIDGDGGSAEIDTAGLDPGVYDFFCAVHPFMVGKLTVE